MCVEREGTDVGKGEKKLDRQEKVGEWIRRGAEDSRRFGSAEVVVMLFVQV